MNSKRCRPRESMRWGQHAHAMAWTRVEAGAPPTREWMQAAQRALETDGILDGSPSKRHKVCFAFVRSCMSRFGVWHRSCKRRWPHSSARCLGLGLSGAQRSCSGPLRGKERRRKDNVYFMIPDRL